MKRQVKAVITVFVVSAILLMGTSFSFADEFSKIESLWGQPVATQKLSNGVEKRFYEFKGEGARSYIFFISKGGTIVDQGTSQKVSGGTLESCDLCRQKGC